MLQTPADTAKSIVARMKKQYSTPHTMVAVDEAEFQHLNLDDYQTFRDMLEEQGFRYIADLEILEVSNAPNSVIARTMIRTMASKDGYITTGYYQVMPNVRNRLKNLLIGLSNMRFIDAPVGFIKAMKTRHCSEFETEFDDGSFLTTSNAQSAGSLSGPLSIESHFFPYGTPISSLLEVHQKRLNEILSSNEGRKPIAMRTLTDILQSGQRLKSLKNAHRAASQWITKEELQKMSGGNPELANEVYAEIQKLLAQEQAARQDAKQ